MPISFHRANVLPPNSSFESIRKVIHGDSSSSKKRGRPTKEEVLEKEKNRVEQENIVKEKLKTLSEEQLPEDIKPLLNVPLFKIGQRVKKISSEFETGMVTKQVLSDPRFVFVHWDDHSRYWVDGKNLEEIKDNKKHGRNK